MVNTVSLGDSVTILGTAASTSLSAGSITVASPTSTNVGAALRFAGGVTQTAGSTLTVSGAVFGSQFTNRFGDTTVTSATTSLSFSSNTNDTFASLTYAGGSSNFTPGGTSNSLTVTGMTTVSSGSLRLNASAAATSLTLGGDVTGPAASPSPATPARRPCSRRSSRPRPPLRPGRRWSSAPAAATADWPATRARTTPSG